jgi:FkbM family methyltransferase
VSASPAIRFALAARERIPDHVYVAVRPYVERVRGLQEPELAFLLTDRSRKGRRFIDVGANWGSYSLLLRPHFESVDCFEPIARCARAIARYAATFKQDIAVHQCALSDRNGTVPFLVPWSADEDVSSSSRIVSADDSSAIEVEARTLDSFGFADVDLMKVDVEGHEREVLAGCEATIRRCRPRLLIEIEQRHIGEPFADRLASIEARGYRTSFVRDGQLVPIREFDLVRDQDPRNIGRGRYINNFLFEPVEPVEPAAD